MIKEGDIVYMPKEKHLVRKIGKVMSCTEHYANVRACTPSGEVYASSHPKFFFVQKRKTSLELHRRS